MGKLRSLKSNFNSVFAAQITIEQCIGLLFSNDCKIEVTKLKQVEGTNKRQNCKTKTISAKYIFASVSPKSSFCIHQNTGLFNLY